MHVHRVFTRAIRHHGWTCVLLHFLREHCAVLVVFDLHLTVDMEWNTAVPNNEEYMSDNKGGANHNQKVSINQKPVASRCYLLKIIQIEDQRSNDGMPSAKDHKDKHTGQGIFVEGGHIGNMRLERDWKSLISTRRSNKLTRICETLIVHRKAIWLSSKLETIANLAGVRLEDLLVLWTVRRRRDLLDSDSKGAESNRREEKDNQEMIPKEILWLSWHVTGDIESFSYFRLCWSIQVATAVLIMSKDVSFHPTGRCFHMFIENPFVLCSKRFFVHSGEIAWIGF